MSTYKVLQDIEAEDKLLGPLTLKQFVFAIITVCLGFIAFFSARANILLVIPWVIPIAFFGFMATPIGRDQPNDVWLAARIRFLIKPRKRVWDQSGMQELVTVTAPKKIEIVRTDGLSQTEVKSRLSALSSMMDTRGWAIKNVDPAINYGGYAGDRLITIDNGMLSVDATDIHPSEDILDPLNNSTAQRIDSAIKLRQQEKLEQLKSSLHGGLVSNNNTAPEKPITPQQNYDFIMNDSPHQDPGYATFGPRVVAPSRYEESGSHNYENTGSRVAGDLGQPKSNPNTEIIQGASVQNNSYPGSTTTTANHNKPQTVTTETAPNAILKELGQANDISVASIANLAKHAEQETDLSDDDIVTLH